jgi:ubiquinone/menaquinone biosynthesis C-methylase UbiE
MKDVPVRAGQRWHAMMPDNNHDEIARQQFVLSLRSGVRENVEPAIRTVFEKRVAPKLAQNGETKLPEVRRAMLRDPLIQSWSALRRTTWEAQWDVAGEAIERDLPRLVDEAAHYRTGKKHHGSLTLDKTVAVPRYNTEIEIHVQPGGYHVEIADDDVFAGALWDRVYTVGEPNRGEWGDMAGRGTAAWVKEHYPDLKPTRILDMGCTIGQSTIPYVDAFPDAEVHAIDVAAPCLRYDFARSEALGKAIHYSQQDAERTNFDDASFDIVVSHLLFHETSTKAVQRIFNEIHRVLKPGGVMIHEDIGNKNDMDTVQRFFFDWMTHYAAEPFINQWTAVDTFEAAVKAGFPRKEVFRDGPGKRYFGARKAA